MYIKLNHIITVSQALKRLGTNPPPLGKLAAYLIGQMIGQKFIG